MRQVTTLGLMLPVVAAMTCLAVTDVTSEPVESAPPGATAIPLMPPHAAMAGAGKKPGDLPALKDVAKDYKKIVSSTDGKKPMYTIWKRDKDAQLLAELPGNFESQLLFLAYTIAGGTPTAGVQSGDMYAKWKRYDKKLALIEPNFGVRTTGDLESQRGHNRVFTDRVILSVPVVAKGASGGPVIDLDGLLLGQASKFFGSATAGLNPSLAKIVKAKAFPGNVEVAMEVPMQGGRLGTLAYSIRAVPKSTGYKTRVADERIGYFTTTHRDIGDPSADSQWVRTINRWKLEKADPKLKLSPPKEPIVFYLEHTVPVRYRRWVRDGVLEWNKAFQKIGIHGALEVYQQDARTGAHMDKDPEDARYNFVLWTNANMGFAIGPSRVDPRTGQILDADIVMDEGFIGSFVRTWRRLIPQIAMENFGPETLEWLETRPQWDPRVRLAPPAERQQVAAEIQRQRAHRMQHGGHVHPAAQANSLMLGDDAYDGLTGRISQVNGMCMHGLAKSMDVALYRLGPEIFADLAARGEGDEDDGDDSSDGSSDDDSNDDESSDDSSDDDSSDASSDEDASDVQMLDGVPESFIGPLLKEVIMHELGHTLGLRHNFKASTVHSLAAINTEEFKGRPHTASVMDYNPVNINMGDGPVQGDYSQVTLGDYDYWVIEYGYTFDRDLKPILSRVAEENIPYATDEDTWGPDPRARRFDYGADPLNYADSQMRLVKHLRGEILDRMVKDGQSWSKARRGYETLLGRQVGAAAIAANWIGGSYINRDRKGDPGDRTPVTPVEADKQRRALQFIIDNTLNDEAYGLTTELLQKMTVDKWWDEGGIGDIFADPSWPVHDRIASIQAASLTMVMNPTTLNRVFDNEFAIDADDDALTLPEVMATIGDAIWSELDERPGREHTARKPFVSSLRRNLQTEHINRLIDLSMPNARFGASGQAISNLSVYSLRQLQDSMESLLSKNKSRLDPYTIAHFSEAMVRIEKALDAQYIYNADDIGGGGGGIMLMFGQDDAK